MIYDVQIQPLDLMALFDLKGSREALSNWCGVALPAFPDRAGTYTVREGMELMWLAPEHWILRAPLDQEDGLAEGLKLSTAPDDISIVRISDTLSFFSVSGPDVGEVMAVATPLDIRPSVFPANAATFSEVFQTKALILRMPDACHVGVDRSFAPMVADYFARTVSD